LEDEEASEEYNNMYVIKRVIRGRGKEEQIPGK